MDAYRASRWADLVEQRRTTNELLRKRRHIGAPCAPVFVPVLVSEPEHSDHDVSEHSEPSEYSEPSRSDVLIPDPESDD